MSLLHWRMHTPPYCFCVKKGAHVILPSTLLYQAVVHPNEFLSYSEATFLTLFGFGFEWKVISPQKWAVWIEYHTEYADMAVLSRMGTCDQKASETHASSLLISRLWVSVGTFEQFRMKCIQWLPSIVLFCHCIWMICEEVLCGT